MKRALYILLGTCFLVLTSCNREWTDQYHQTIFVASVKHPSGGYYYKVVGQEQLHIEPHDVNNYGKLWFVLKEPIHVFDEIYQEGYEYLIGIRIEYKQSGTPNHAITMGRTYTLEHLVLKTKSDTFIDPNKVQIEIFEN